MHEVALPESPGKWLYVGPAQLVDSSAFVQLYRDLSNFLLVNGSDCSDTMPARRFRGTQVSNLTVEHLKERLSIIII